MGKRPDQYRIDPSEGGATDYKNLPQTGRGKAGHLDTPEIDRRQVAKSREEAKGQPFPPDVPAPTVDVKRGARQAADRPHEPASEPREPESGS